MEDYIYPVQQLDKIDAIEVAMDKVGTETNGCFYVRSLQQHIVIISQRIESCYLVIVGAQTCY